MKVCRQVLKTWLTNKIVYFLSDGEKKTVITIGKNNIDKKLCFSIVLNKAGKEKKTNLRTPDAVITKA